MQVSLRPTGTPYYGHIVPYTIISIQAYFRTLMSLMARKNPPLRIETGLCCKELFVVSWSSQQLIHSGRYAVTHTRQDMAVGVERDLDGGVAQ